MKNVHWTEEAWEEYVHWQQNDPPTTTKINALIRECLRTPFVGIGKPEPLRGELSGFWSRRITAEHRFVYKVFGKPDNFVLSIVACRFHYNNLGGRKNN